MPLRALTYNILVGGEERLPFIRDIIGSQNADIVAIQEANSRANIESLARDLEMRLVFGEANCEYHVALLSRLPITGSMNHRAPEFEKTALEVEVQWEGHPVRVITTHLKANSDEQRRVTEVETLLRLTGPADAGLKLLMGDFNALSPADQYVSDIQISDEDDAFARNAYAAPRHAIPLLLAAGYVDIYRQTRPGETGYTTKTPTPVVRIDYIFASPALALRATLSDVVDSPLVILASDHKPVCAEFE
jgi:endonuclease/exonuclease/phosphatase family metal-dependent hydrolase